MLDLLSYVSGDSTSDPCTFRCVPDRFCFANMQTPETGLPTGSRRTRALPSSTNRLHASTSQTRDNLDSPVSASLVDALFLGDNLFQCGEPRFKLGHDDVLGLAKFGVECGSVGAGGHGQLYL